MATFPEDSMTLPNHARNWGPSVQIHGAHEEHTHSNYYMGSGLKITTFVSKITAYVPLGWSFAFNIAHQAAFTETSFNSS